ncbi:hypothetical protein [Thiolapillus sp.]|uniref:hypothetical protein n=1 Tax=Thiolapillus sp. TaxID=2017437 RepID=UPI0025D13B3D|nr:hypothetical protein [Thiolapillus sp.]
MRYHRPMPMEKHRLPSSPSPREPGGILPWSSLFSSSAPPHPASLRFALHGWQR